MRRYVVRRQENRDYCVWDVETDRPAEADGRRYVDLPLDEALDFAAQLNGAEKPS